MTGPMARPLEFDDIADLLQERIDAAKSEARRGSADATARVRALTEFKSALLRRRWGVSSFTGLLVRGQQHPEPAPVPKFHLVADDDGQTITTACSMERGDAFIEDLATPEETRVWERLTTGDAAVCGRCEASGRWRKLLGDRHTPPHEFAPQGQARLRRMVGSARS